VRTWTSWVSAILLVVGVLLLTQKHWNHPALEPLPVVCTAEPTHAPGLEPGRVAAELEPTRFRTFASMFSGCSALQRIDVSQWGMADGPEPPTIQSKAPRQPQATGDDVLDFLARLSREENQRMEAAE